MLADLRFAVRLLLKTPGFTALAVLTLALAIGVNSAIFTLIHGIVLRPVIPLRPAEVVNLFTAREGAARDYRQFSHEEYLALRGETAVFADVAAHTAVLTGLGEGSTLRRSFAFFASDNFFPLLGTTPERGRFFTAEESKPNANLPVVIASHRLWQRNGSRADFIGSTLRLNGRPFTVIGVTRPDFSGLNALLAPDVWLPLGQFTQFAESFVTASERLDLARPTAYTLNLTARLAPAVDATALTTRLPALAERINALRPAADGERRALQFEAPSRLTISTEPAEDPPLAQLAVALLAMASCVLLIACLNLANMLLARGTARAKEIAVRLALGSTRWQIVRQLLVEGLVLALAGGMLGLIFALWSNDLLLASLEGLFSTMNFSLALSATPSPAVLAATFAWCLVATVLFALGPAWRVSRTNLVADLKRQGGEAAAGGGLQRFFAPRQLLVMGQIALSVMLIFSAGLFVRAAHRAARVPLGFNPNGQLVAELDSSLGSRGTLEAQRNYFSVLEQVQRLPGVTHAALGTQLPYSNVTNAPRFADARTPATPPASSATTPNPAAPPPGANALLCAITPDWFETLGVRLLRGRHFTAEETRDERSRRVAIIDESLARRLFPDEDPIGLRLRYAQPPLDGSPAELEIVGLCAPHRQDALHANDRPRVFVPLAQGFSTNVFLHVRFANESPAAVAAAVAPLRRALHSADASLPVLGITPMSTLLDRNLQLWIVRLGGAFFGAFGLIALLLAVVGVYGVKSYAVARRAREIGIRMALGARPGEVLQLVLGQGLRQTAVAIAAGLLLALAAGQLLGALLARVSPQDPLALTLAALVLAGAATIATWIPARRASRVDPARVLRAE